MTNGDSRLGRIFMNTSGRDASETGVERVTDGAVSSEQVVIGRGIHRVKFASEHSESGEAEGEAVIDEHLVDVVFRALPGSEAPFEVHLRVGDVAGVEVSLGDLMATVVRVGDELARNYGAEPRRQWEAAKREAIGQPLPQGSFSHVLMPKYIVDMEISEVEPDA